jgi:predicted HTH transcriptional regulator
MTNFPPAIMNVFHRTGAVEIWGRGTNSVIAECERDGIAPPVFEERQGFIIVTFKVLIASEVTRQVTHQVTPQVTHQVTPEVTPQYCPSLAHKCPDAHSSGQDVQIHTESESN